MEYKHTPEFIRAAERFNMTADQYLEYISSDSYKKRHADLDIELANYDEYRAERIANCPFLKETLGDIFGD